MSKAGELMERVLSKMEERKLYAYYKNGIHNKGEEVPAGFSYTDEKHLSVMETYRSNGTEENVTVTIEGCIRLSDYSSRRVLKVKVPKNASDRVIDRRLDEVEKWFKG